MGGFVVNDILILAFAAVAATYVATESDLFSEVRAPILHKLWQHKWLPVRKLGDLFSCPYCLSWWSIVVVGLIAGGYDLLEMGAAYGVALGFWQAWFAVDKH
jgi:hypothetical protein